MSFPVRKSLKGRRAVVLGSCPAGLATAVALAVRGARVVVLEESSVPGGALRAPRVGAFRFDPPPGLVTAPQVLSELFASADLRLSDFLTLRQEDLLGRFHLEEKIVVDWFREPERTATELEKIDAADAKRVLDVFRLARRFHRVAEADDHSRPLRDQSRRPAFASLDAAPILGELLAPGSLAFRLKRTLATPRMRNLVLAMVAASGGLGRRTRPSGLAGVGRQITDGGWAVEGGSQAVLTALIRLCEITGVKIACGVRVEKIELENGRVRRVTGKGMKPIAASIVVGTSDPLALVRELIPDAPASPPRKRPAPPPPVRSEVRFLIGTDCQWSQLAPCVNYLVPGDVTAEVETIDRWRIPGSQPLVTLMASDPADRDAAPEGGQALHARMEAPASTPRFRWADGQVDTQTSILQRMLTERGFKDFPAHIVEERVILPGEPLINDSARHEAVTSLPYFGLEGRARLSTPRLREVPGLYLCGPFARPGIGLSGELLGGMIAAVCAAEDAR